MSQPVELALSALELARAGRFSEIRDLFAPQLQPLVVPEVLATAWSAELERQGPVASIGAPVSEPGAGDMVVVKVPVTCQTGGFTLIAPVTAGGLLAGLQLAPLSAAAPVAPWERPAYADPDSFDEHEVTLGSAPLAVAGTITVPRRPGTAPAVVLLAGSGPVDRDETIGRNKPFKDVAWGLATRGIAVLRFDKVTFAHARELARVEQFTLDDEYLPHALAAVRLLQDHPGVDRARVFVLGHSLGGTVAPRVLAAAPSIAGLVVLAGGVQPLHWAIVRQHRYLASLRPELEVAAQPVIERLTEQARLIDSPELTPATPRDRLPLGVPVSYWLDLRDYDAAELAATLGKPTLILQGARDYQATVADDLARWKAALDGHTGVTIRVYPDLNHLFAPGTGPSSPAEYEPAQHVDPIVIGDVAAWLTGRD